MRQFWQTACRVSDHSLLNRELSRASDATDALYEKIERVVGLPSRRHSDFEIADEEIIEDAEVMELIAGVAEDVTEDP